MIPYRFLPAAEHELDGASEHYEHERQGLGSEFLDEVAAVLNRARRFPQMGTRLNDAGAALEVRRYLLRRFPYKLIAVVRSEKLIVVAVAQSGQHPAYWMPRIAKVR